MAIHRNFAAYDGRISSEPRLPVGVAENHYRIGSQGLAFRRKDKSTEFRLDSQRREKISGDVAGHDAIGFTIHAQTVQAKLVGEHIGEYFAGLAANVAKVGHGKLCLYVSFLLLEREDGDLGGILHRQRPQ